MVNLAAVLILGRAGFLIGVFLTMTFVVLLRDEKKSEVLADTVKEYDGILGAAVCCSDKGGLETDDWTTCDNDRGVLLDRIFTLAKQRNLLLDFHVDENGNERSKGLRDIALKTIEHGYQGKVVCGHCWYARCHHWNCVL
jgi:cytosine/creatinine deaminase